MANIEFLEFEQSPSQRAREAVLRANVRQEGHWIFANGGHGLIKLEMDNLWDHPEALAIILQQLSGAHGVSQADVVLGVPTGGSRLAEALVQTYLSKPMARLERVRGGAKQDFQFCSEADRALALSAHDPLVLDDVFTTGSSLAGVTRLLDQTVQDIHAVAIWRRGELLEAYRAGLASHHALIEEHIPVYAPEHCPHCNAA